MQARWLDGSSDEGRRTIQTFAAERQSRHY